MNVKPLYDELSTEERIEIVNSDARLSRTKSKGMEERLNECIAAKIDVLDRDLELGDPCGLGFICGGFPWPFDSEFRKGKPRDPWCRHCARTYDIFKRHF